MAVENNVTNSPAFQKPSQLPILSRMGRVPRKTIKAKFAILSNNKSIQVKQLQ